MAVKETCIICGKEFTYNHYEDEDSLLCKSCLNNKIRRTTYQVDKKDTEFIKNFINSENILS